MSDDIQPSPQPVPCVVGTPYYRPPVPWVVGTPYYRPPITITDEEREAIAGAIASEHGRGAFAWAATLRKLLERLG
jgi:hypothetical protein